MSYKSAKDAIDKGKKIDDKTLKKLSKKKNKTAYNLAKKYNDALAASNTANNNLTKAQNA